MNTLTTFRPLMRQTVGFDRFNDLFDTLLNQSEDRFEAYPPYNIEKVSDDEYRITMAVAGFTDADLDITAEGDRLIIRGNLGDKPEDEGAHYLHRGIATRSFERTFRLADHIEVVNADLRDGLLIVNLKREIPDHKKPRMVPINGKSKSLVGKSKKKVN